MVPLEELSLPKRLALAVLIVAAAVLVLWVSSKVLQAAAPREDVSLYENVPLDAQLLALDKLALSDAYHDQLVHLWTIWLRGQARSSTEFSNGLRLARQSYAIAAKAIAEREQQLQHR